MARDVQEDRTDLCQVHEVAHHQARTTMADLVKIERHQVVVVLARGADHRPAKRRTDVLRGGELVLAEAVEEAAGAA